jgi:hypothetical protein
VAIALVTALATVRSRRRTSLDSEPDLETASIASTIAEPEAATPRIVEMADERESTAPP